MTARLAQIRSAHIPEPMRDSKSGRKVGTLQECKGCSQPWPCEAAYLLAVAVDLDREIDHIGHIEVRESITEDRPVYRPRCPCGWFGWAVLHRDNAQRQLDRHTGLGATKTH